MIQRAKLDSDTIHFLRCLRGGAVAVGVIVVDVMLFDGVDGVVVVIVVGGVDTPAEQKLR